MAAAERLGPDDSKVTICSDRKSRSKERFFFSVSHSCSASISLLTTVSPTGKRTEVGRRRNVRVQNLRPSGHGGKKRFNRRANELMQSDEYANRVSIYYYIILIVFADVLHHSRPRPTPIVFRVYVYYIGTRHNKYNIY